MSDKTTVPRATVEQIAQAYRELEVLRRKQAGTMAEMIRACVANLDIDVMNHGMRGHETHQQKAEQTRKNKTNKAQARLYLLALATQLEDASGEFDISSETPIIRAR